MLAFAKAFLMYLTKIKLDTRYHAFEVSLERSKSPKARKNVASRILIKDDIENILTYIKNSECNGCISRDRTIHYIAFVVFGAYTGRHSLATMSKLTVGQFKAVLQLAICTNLLSSMVISSTGISRIEHISLRTAHQALNGHTIDIRCVSMCLIST